MRRFQATQGIASSQCNVQSAGLKYSRLKQRGLLLKTQPAFLRRFNSGLMDWVSLDCGEHFPFHQPIGMIQI